MKMNPPTRPQLTTETKTAIRVSNQRAAHALTFLMIFGPGLIVMEADNDAGTVSTYVQAGRSSPLLPSAIIFLQLLLNDTEVGLLGFRVLHLARLMHG